MKKATLILTVALSLVLLTLPAMADFRVLSDQLNRSTGIGEAVVQLSDTMFAKITYRDADRSGGFSAGDIRLRTEYLRRGVNPDDPKVGHDKKVVSIKGAR